MIFDLLRLIGVDVRVSVNVGQPSDDTGKKYMSPKEIGRHYGPEAQAAAEKREREREARE